MHLASIVLTSCDTSQILYRSPSFPQRFEQAFQLLLAVVLRRIGASACPAGAAARRKGNCRVFQV